MVHNWRNGPGSDTRPAATAEGSEYDGTCDYTSPQKEKVASYNSFIPLRTRKPPATLPAFIPPMLAKPGTAFDSDDHLFEIKWDGTRTLAFVEGKECRLLNRRRIDMTERYPEFECLARFPAGTVLEGETVVLRDGRLDFGMLQSREQARSPLKIRYLARAMPATYIVFDLLLRQAKSHILDDAIRM